MRPATVDRPSALAMFRNERRLGNSSANITRHTSEHQQNTTGDRKCNGALHPTPLSFCLVRVERCAPAAAHEAACAQLLLVQRLANRYVPTVVRSRATPADIWLGTERWLVDWGETLARRARVHANVRGVARLKRHADALWEAAWHHEGSVVLPLRRVTKDDAHAVSEVVVRVAVCDPLPRIVRDKACHNISTKRHIHRVLHDIPAWRDCRSNLRPVCWPRKPIARLLAVSERAAIERRLHGWVWRVTLLGTHTAQRGVGEGRIGRPYPYSYLI
eukprot:scaffold97694_cov65-Phaeocystis_antarctica.AAC.1